MLATICLFPVDIALVSTTVDRNLGLRKPWASPERVANIVFSLKIVYYSIYPLMEVPDSSLVWSRRTICLLIIPFSYFWYEEWDEESTLGSRVRGALKYSILFLVITVALLLTGFFIPLSHDLTGHVDLDYLKHLLSENRMTVSFCNTDCRWRESSFLCPWGTTVRGYDFLRRLHGSWTCLIPHHFDQTYPIATNQR